MQTSARYPWGKGTPRWVLDATANDSDKAFTVPAGKIWELLSVTMGAVTSATVGDRYFVLSISNGAAVVYYSARSNAVAANTTFVAQYNNGAAMQNAVGRPDIQGNNLTPAAVQTDWLPKMYLPAGYIVRVYDFQAVAVATDDMTVALHYVEYDA